jgi:hypothetical protein
MLATYRLKGEEAVISKHLTTDIAMRASSVHRFRTTAALRAAVTIPALLGLALVLGQPIPAAAQAKHELPSFSNLEHSLRVRKALAQDKELAALNVGVKVENQVATLWGAVPSAKLLSKVVQVTRAVPEILEVRCYLYVDETELPEPKYLPEPGMSWVAPAWPAASVMPGANPGPGQTTAAVKTPGSWQPVVEQNTSFKPVTVTPLAGSEDQALYVLPAIAVPLAPGNSASPTLPLAISLKERVLNLKNGNWRYQYVDLVVDENRVYVDGLVYQWSDLEQLTKAIVGLPGVGNVIVGQIRIKPMK